MEQSLLHQRLLYNNSVLMSPPSGIKNTLFHQTLQVNLTTSENFSLLADFANTFHHKTDSKASKKFGNSVAIETNLTAMMRQQL